MSTVSYEMETSSDLILSLACFVSFVTNSLAYFHIKKTFDLSQSLYYILALGSLSTAALSLGQFLVFLYRVFDPEPSILVCVFVSEAIGIFLNQTPLSFLTSLIRYNIEKIIFKKIGVQSITLKCLISV